MRKSILTLLICALSLTAFAQADNTKVSHVKKIRHTSYFLDDAMTELEVRLDDQHIIHYFYDLKGNLVLERKRVYNVNKTTTYISYQYNEKNQLTEKRDGNTRYVYTYENDLQTKREKFTEDALQETINYEYTDGVLSKESKYNVNGDLSLYYTYEYDSKGTILNRYSYNKSDKNTAILAYTYDEQGRLIEERNSTISTSTSSLGKVRSATRIVYTYDEQGRLSVETNQTATVSGSEGITGWTNGDKYIYLYEGTSTQVSRKELHQWSTDKEKYDIHEHDDYYVSSRYGNEYVPQNINIALGTSITKVPVTLEKPAVTADLKGYQVIADNVLLDTLYTTESFFIENQVKGNHNYRVVAVYDSVPATVSDDTNLTIEVILAAPSNAIVESQEYSVVSGWNVTFTFTPPVYSEELTLTGYRFKVIGGNGGKTGNTDAMAQKISFQLYNDTRDNETNLCTVELYAVYVEGESDPYTFQIDLRDTQNQIIVKWANERSERTDAKGTLLDSKHYYYKSDATGEVLVATVDYTVDNVPTLRHTKVDGIEYTETWNAETMQWDKYKMIEKTTEKFDVGESIYDYYTTKEYNAESGAYEPIEMKEQYSICTIETGYRVVLTSTSNYVYENGEKVLKSFIKHYSTNDYSFASDTLFAADKTTMTGLVEYNYYATFNKEYGYLLTQTLVSQKTYRYENGQFIAIEEMEQVTNPQNNLITSRTISMISESGDKSLVETTTFFASKEYGSIKAPASASYADNILTWSAPSNPNMVPTGYRVFVNNIPYADTEGETSIEIAGIPSGKYTFTVMALYNGSESSYSTSTTGTYTAQELTYDLPMPTPELPDGTIINTKDADVIKLAFTFDRNVYAQDTENMAYAEYVGDGTKYNVTLIADENDNSKWSFSMEWNEDSKLGDYRFVVPAGTFGDETAFASDFTYGMVNAEFEFGYGLSLSAVESIENDVVIYVMNRNIIAPADAKVYNVQGIETGRENVAPGIYVVVYQNNVTKVHVR